MVCPGVELPEEVHASPENHPQDGEAPGQDARDGVAAPGVQQVRQAPLRARPRHLHRQQEGGGAEEGGPHQLHRGTGAVPVAYCVYMTVLLQKGIFHVRGLIKPAIFGSLPWA